MKLPVMRALALLLFAFAVLASTSAHAHSPYQSERARIQLDDGRVLSIRLHWGDGIFFANPVMPVAVIDNGSGYGTPVAIGPVSDRGRIGVRCTTLDNCNVDYFGIGPIPTRSFQLNPSALDHIAVPPDEWEWCVDRDNCAVSGFDPVPSPLLTLEPFSARSLRSSLVNMAPVILAMLLIGLAGPAPKTWPRKVLRWMGLAAGWLCALLAMIWVPLNYFFYTAPSLVTDIALIIATAAVVMLVQERQRRVGDGQPDIA